MSTTTVSISADAAAVSNAPRVITTRKTTRYEFRSFEAFNECLKNGTMKLHMDAHVNKDTGRPVNYTFKGQYSDHPVGDVHIALKSRELEVMDNSGKFVRYNLLQFKDKDFEKRKDKEDTQTEFDITNTFFSTELQKIFDRFFPNKACSIHCPKALKLKTPAKAVHKTISPEGEEDHDEGVDVMELMAEMKGRPGKLMVKLGSPWMMERESQEHVLVGMTYILGKAPFLTDAERQEINAKKNSERAAKRARTDED